MNKPAATRRILDAARDLVVRGGAAEISIGDAAALAGVSKALVHYHFRDKETLLAALVDDVGVRVIARERACIDVDESAHALDAYWNWLRGELDAGDLRVLIALGEFDSGSVRAASRRIAAARRDAAATHIGHVFARLGLAVRLPPPLVAESVVAFIDGLAISRALNPDHDPRPAFDVLWLALLTLTE